MFCFKEKNIDSFLSPPFKDQDIRSFFFSPNSTFANKLLEKGIINVHENNPTLFKEAKQVIFYPEDQVKAIISCLQKILFKQNGDDIFSNKEKSISIMLFSLFSAEELYAFKPSFMSFLTIQLIEQKVIKPVKIPKKNLTSFADIKKEIFQQECHIERLIPILQHALSERYIKQIFPELKSLKNLMHLLLIIKPHSLEMPRTHEFLKEFCAHLLCQRKNDYFSQYHPKSLSFLISIFPNNMQIRSLVGIIEPFVRENFHSHADLIVYLMKEKFHPDSVTTALKFAFSDQYIQKIFPELEDLKILLVSIFTIPHKELQDQTTLVNLKRMSFDLLMRAHDYFEKYSPDVIAEYFKDIYCQKDMRSYFKEYLNDAMRFKS